LLLLGQQILYRIKVLTLLSLVSHR